MRNVLLFITGLIIFLLGLYILKLALKSMKSINFKKLIASITRTPLLGCSISSLLTMLLQSSSAVTVITIGLVDTGLMTFPQAIGIILGTNIGTTITGQIMAFHLESWGGPMVLIGLILIIFTRRKLCYLGLNVLGLGLIFLGMNYMGEAFLFIRDNLLFNDLLRLTTRSILLAVCWGIIFTAIIQSSSAMTGIVLVLAKNGQIDLVTATGIILGSNVGTCVTAILASIGSSIGGKRVAISHVILNLFGVLVFFPFIESFTNIMAATSTDLPRQIAHTHTVFNIISSVAVLPFANLFARFICWLVPNN